MTNMKTIRLFAVVALMTTATFAFSNAGSEDFAKAKAALEQAVEKHNYRDAKGSLQELLPLMKSDIKQSKKAINALKKQADRTILKDALDNLKRKEEIFKQLEHLVDISPAALRVKATQVLDLVLEYDELVEVEA